MPITSDQYRQIMRRYPAAVTIISTGRAPERSGMTATAVMSLSAEPVRVVCAINRSSLTFAHMERNGFFCVNTLSQEQTELATLFAGRDTRFGEERFSEEHWTTLESGAPVLRQAVMALDCRLNQCIEMGTHALVIGDVLAGTVVATQPPLLYVDGRWAGLDTRLACAA
jgi:flavin reductase (DIM6/NTAB) family NADH-FMN oxidoreductase RutF